MDIATYRLGWPRGLFSENGDMQDSAKVILKAVCFNLVHNPAAEMGKGNLFIYQARESSLVPAGFLTAQFLQKL